MADRHPSATSARVQPDWIHGAYPSATTVSATRDRVQHADPSAQFAFKAEYLPDTTDELADCNQDLWLTVFFDGTGNNEKIDAPTFEHSNVARLFRAMQKELRAEGRFNIYVPGIGTPFREIGDPGGKAAMAVALGGQERLKWAMQQIEDEVRSAEARARNPVNKIRRINIALFGFSRGAALARAFALQVSRKCRKHLAGTGQLWEGRYPARLYFMGLFDSVAAVGVPTSARKYRREAQLAQLPLGPVVGAIPVLVASAADGHMGWASELQIPAMVEECVHYCAAHENRNAFPLDTVLVEGSYPSNCTEVVYPGVHSNVGGGYRPGEGGRNNDRFAMISLIPLKAMYDAAVRAGVPLRDIWSAESRVRDDFLPPHQEATAERNLLSERFNHYMTTVGWGGRPIGSLVSDHMRMYFRWRIVHVGRKINAAREGRVGWEEQRLQTYSSTLAQERRDKLAEQERRQAALAAAGQGNRRYEQLRWDLIMQKAMVNTMPADAEDLIAALAKFDQQFLDDSDRVRRVSRDQLRPFEQVLRDAWEAPALTDPAIIAFFDEYVTDSLAGFDSDRTRAIEHRWLYQGGDSTIDYAAAGQPEVAVA